VGEGMVLPPQRWARPLPYTGKVLKEKANSWHHDRPPLRARIGWSQSCLR
jgi:hypothetical protein